MKVKKFFNSENANKAKISNLELANTTLTRDLTTIAKSLSDQAPSSQDKGRILGNLLTLMRRASRVISVLQNQLSSVNNKII